jgi:hypothetical protein
MALRISVRLDERDELKRDIALASDNQDQFNARLAQLRSVFQDDGLLPPEGVDAWPITPLHLLRGD